MKFWAEAKESEATAGDAVYLFRGEFGRCSTGIQVTPTTWGLGFEAAHVDQYRLVIFSIGPFHSFLQREGK